MGGSPRRGGGSVAWHTRDESPAGMRTWSAAHVLESPPLENTEMLPLAGRSIVNTHRLGSSLRRTATAFALVAVLLGAATARAASPDFDSVPWTAIGCPAAKL